MQNKNKYQYIYDKIKMVKIYKVTTKKFNQNIISDYVPGNKFGFQSCIITLNLQK